MIGQVSTKDLWGQQPQIHSCLGEVFHTQTWHIGPFQYLVATECCEFNASHSSNLQTCICCLLVEDTGKYKEGDQRGPQGRDKRLQLLINTASQTVSPTLHYPCGRLTGSTLVEGGLVAVTSSTHWMYLCYSSWYLRFRDFEMFVRK